MQVRRHRGVVALPLTASRPKVECIGIRVDTDTLELAQDSAPYHLAQFLVGLGKRHIRPHLRTGVSQPHGMDIARIDKGVVIAVLCSRIMDGRIERVGEAILKHPRQIRCIAKQGFHFLDFLFYGFRGKQALFGGRAPCRTDIVGRQGYGLCICFDLLLVLSNGSGGGKHKRQQEQDAGDGLHDGLMVKWLILKKGKDTRSFPL